MRFTQRALEVLSDGSYRDETAPNLIFRVRGKHKNWVFRKQVARKVYDLGLGGFPKVSCAQAKKFSGYLRALSDTDFLAEIEKRQKRKNDDGSVCTFRQTVEQFIEWNVRVGNWDELGKAHKVFEGRMRMYILPKIGDKPINEVSADDVAKIAEGIWHMPETVNRCLRFTRQVFNWAKAKGIATIDNPADRKGALQYLLPQQRHISKNRGAISVAELPEFFAEMYEQFGNSSSGRCFLFAVLTATRSGTARAARWEQIDLDNAEWLIPPQLLKMSGNGALLVPLAQEVVRLLKSWGPQREGLVFPGPKGRELSDSMVSRLIALSGREWLDTEQTTKTGKPVRATLHGVARATFRTWAQDDRLGNDKRFDARIAELCLHHKVADIYNGAYERNQSYLRRREMMSAWARYCFSRIQKDSKEHKQG